MKENYSNAISYFKKAKDFSVTTKDIILIHEANEGLAKSYLKNSQPNMALIFFDKTQETQDSFNLIKNKERALTLFSEMQSKQREHDIAMLVSQKELNDQQNANQRNLLITGVFILILILIVVWQLYQNKKKSNTKLRELDVMKSNFFANISHEFRTPLTLIIGSIQEKLDSRNTSEEHRRALKNINRNSNRLLELVNQLLDLSKIDAGKMTLKLQEGDVSNFLNTLVESFEHQAQKKDIPFDIEINIEPKNTWFDYDVLEKVVSNLLSNAFKYVSSKGEVTFSAIQTVESKLDIIVTNSYSDKIEETPDKFFDRFFQGDSQSNGVGIGLALTRELVLLHGGTIHMQQELDNTIKLTTSWPLHLTDFSFYGKNKNEYVETRTKKDNDSPVGIAFEEIENFNQKPILLVVEDNKEVQNFIGNFFKNRFQIVNASDGKEGIKKAMEHIPDLIISDIMMPKSNGMELTKTLKKDQRTSHIPIILLTAKADEESTISGINSGADDYITKPFNVRILKSKVERLIVMRRKLREKFSQQGLLKSSDISINSIEDLFLKKVQNVLNQALIEPSFSAEQFSKATGMSRMQLHRKLKALTGLSTSEFIRSQRLKLAADLLLNSDVNVSQISYSVGFGDHSYFSKCFKEAYGITPSEYTKQNIAETKI